MSLSNMLTWPNKAISPRLSKPKVSNLSQFKSLKNDLKSCTIGRKKDNTILVVFFCYNFYLDNTNKIGKKKNAPDLFPVFDLCYQHNFSKKINNKIYQ